MSDQPENLTRYGVTWRTGHSIDDPLLTPISDGFWTPWHIADAALTEARSRLHWQPIETAPKDGTRLMLYACKYRRHWFGSGYYFKGVPGDGEGWIAHSFYTAPVNDSSGSFSPTHWMALPAPPTERT